LPDEVDQSIASPLHVGVAQARTVGHDGPIESAAHVGGRRHIDVGEDGRRDHAKGRDPDQGELEGRRA
jgi:hypothetical protein